MYVTTGLKQEIKNEIALKSGIDFHEIIILIHTYGTNKEISARVLNNIEYLRFDGEILHFSATDKSGHFVRGNIFIKNSELLGIWFTTDGAERFSALLNEFYQDLVLTEEASECEEYVSDLEETL